ncbi:MAG: CBS domain-containing protein [Mariprofundaceae bacterium]
MKVSDAMTSEVIAVGTGDSLREAVAKMTIHNVAQVSVLNDDGGLAGIITVRDVMMPLYPDQGDYVHDSVRSHDFEDMETNYAKVMKMAVTDVMTANPITVSSDDPVLKATSYMGLKNLRRIPVVDAGKQVGVLSIENVNSALFISNAG